jgi:pimeloyl-ACP methyl ester carboxylesterase
VTRLLHYRHDGLTFDVRDEGPLDGDPVVLLHGFPERSTCWREVAPLLHRHGLRTYAPDQRGYSPGARPPRRRDYTMDKLEADVVALLETIGAPVHLVGHDWGASSGWLVATHRPELLLSWTAISVPHPAAFRRALVSSRQLLSSWYMGAFQLPLLPERLAAAPGGRFDQGLRNGGMTRDEVDRFRREIVDDGALRGALNWYRAIPFSRQRLLEGTVEVPTTLLWSDGDIAVKRPAVERCADHVTGPYELRVLEGVSHWIPTHAPQAVADAVLSRIESASSPQHE